MHKKNFRIYAFILLCITFIIGDSYQMAIGQADPFHYQSRRSGIFPHAAIACAHPLASEAGKKILQQGGNAFDAAVTVQLVLSVVYPEAGNIGGGGFLVGKPVDKSGFSLDFRETAPAKATEHMYIDKKGILHPDWSREGPLATGVPGTIAGIFATLPYCKLPLKKLIEPAISLAENGFAITEKEANNLNENKTLLLKNGSKHSALVRSIPWKAGDTLVQKELANTLKKIRDYGKKGFYEGTTAHEIVKTMKAYGGLITLEDLKNYKVQKRNLLQFSYKGDYEIFSMAPPSSGGILLCEMMKAVENRGLATKKFGTDSSIQLMVEAERRAFADRSEWMGDPSFFKVPIKGLTDSSYIEKRMQDYRAGHISSGIKASDSSDLFSYESHETTHISIIDQYGNMVSITTTLNGNYGCHTVAGHAGFLLNNEMDDFSAQPGAPNMYGAIGGKANSIQPGKRMLSSMSPTLVMHNGQPYISIGTPGGTTIPTSVFQGLINIIEFNMDAKEAINAPRFHDQWSPDKIMMEKPLFQSAGASLQKMGYELISVHSIGKMECIRIKASGEKEAAADPRGDDSVAGF